VAEELQIERVALIVEEMEVFIIQGRVMLAEGVMFASATLFKDKLIPKETRDYLAKSLGKNGFLELYVVNDL
jgi:hypothetical protein